MNDNKRKYMEELKSTQADQARGKISIETKRGYTSNDFETFDDDELGVHVVTCVNCGAFAQTQEAVKHYKNCRPGESEKWRKYYNEPEYIPCPNCETPRLIEDGYIQKCPNCGDDETTLTMEMDVP